MRSFVEIWLFDIVTQLELAKGMSRCPHERMGPTHPLVGGCAAPRNEGQREGRGPRASLPDFAGIVPATRGLMAAPWTPASLALLPAQKRVKISHRTW